MASSSTGVARPAAASRRGLVVAALAAGAGAAVLGRYGPSGRGLVAGGLAAVLVVLSAIDLERRVLPNAIVLPAIPAALLAQLILSPERWLEWVLAGAGAAALLLLPLVVDPAGVGMGDVKLAFLLGVVLGKGVVLALVVASLAVLPVALGLLLLHGAAARQMGVPFGPFLALGALVTLLLG